MPGGQEEAAQGALLGGSPGQGHLPGPLVPGDKPGGQSAGYRWSRACGSWTSSGSNGRAEMNRCSGDKEQALVGICAAGRQIGSWAERQIAECAELTRRPERPARHQNSKVPCASRCRGPHLHRRCRPRGLPAQQRAGISEHPCLPREGRYTPHLSCSEGSPSRSSKHTRARRSRGDTRQPDAPRACSERTPKAACRRAQPHKQSVGA